MTKQSEFRDIEWCNQHLDSLPEMHRFQTIIDLRTFCRGGMPTHAWAVVAAAIEAGAPLPEPVAKYLHQVARKLMQITLRSPKAGREAAVYRALGYAKTGRGPGSPIAAFQRSRRAGTIATETQTEINRLKNAGHSRGVETAAVNVVAVRHRVSASYVRRCYKRGAFLCQY